MLSSDLLRRSVSLVLTSLLVASPAVSLAESPALPIAGAVSAQGNVQVRGVSLSREGTLFFGDSIRVGAGSHGNLRVNDGNRIELFNDTQCVVEKGPQGARIALTSGNVGFSASSKPVSIAFAGYEVLPEAGATGGVMFLANEYVGIKVMTGKATVRNLTTGKTSKLSANDVRIVNLKTQDMNVSLAQLASAGPIPLPSTNALPQASGGGGGISPTAWALIIAGIGAGTAISVHSVLTNDDNASPH